MPIVANLCGCCQAPLWIKDQDINFMKKVFFIVILIAVLGGGFLAWRRLHTNTPARGGEKALQTSAVQQNETPIYTDPKSRFSFTYPAGYVAHPIEEGNIGETLLVQKGTGPKTAFQIFISEFDEPGPITKARILKDVPDMVVNEPTEAIIGKERVTAFIFKSKEPSVGDTREIWLVAGGYLYQITAPIDLDPEVAEMMKTWTSQVKN